ncbi:MAG: hypothetical protein ACR2NP_10035, partial [Pirellulaceae bacterium]
MLYSFRLRWKLVALIVFVQAILVASMALAQSTVQSPGQDWRSAYSNSSYEDASRSSDYWHQEEAESDANELAPGQAPDGTPTIDTQASETQEFSLTEYFDTLSAEDKSRFSWNLANGWTITPFGYLRGEMIYATDNTTADAAIFFFSPNNLDVDDDSLTLHAKSSFLNFALTGPDVCGWESGGLIAINFLGPQPIRNQSGFNVVGAFGYLKRNGWQLKAGRMPDLFSPISPTAVNIAGHRAAGNVGIFRGAMDI